MAYDLRHNRAAFTGAPSPWAKSLAAIMCDIWIDSGAQRLHLDVFAHTHQPFVLMPKVGRCQIEAVVIHQPKLDSDRVKGLLHADGFGNLELLTEHWRAFGRAFVHFTINPFMPDPLQVLNHNGSILAVREFIDLERRALPALEEFDKALGCELVLERHECNRIVQLHGDPPLPKLRNRDDTGCRVTRTGEVIWDCNAHHR